MSEYGIMPSLDMDLGKAIKLIKEIESCKGIHSIKIGASIIEEYGMKSTKRLFDESGFKLPLCYDPQKGGTDVPFIVKKQVRMARKLLEPDYYIGAPLGAGKKTLKTFVNTCFNNDIEPIIVVEMSHPGAITYTSKIMCEQLARDCKNLGVKRIVAPATKPERLKVYKSINPEFIIISPGVGLQRTGNVIKDARDAVKGGADVLVIGRGICNNPNPMNVIKNVYNTIKKAYNEREF